MTHQLITEIASDNSKLHKEAVIRREALAQNDEFFAGLRYALDNIDTFGVKKVPMRTGLDGPGLSFLKFSDLANNLIARKITGHAALAAIDNAMQLASNAEWNGWYRLILIKDLKADFSEKTVNRVCKKDFSNYAIDIFECQLAKDCVNEEGDVDETMLKGKKQIDVKLDGMRVLTIVFPNGKVDQFSRNGNELHNFGFIKNQISKIANKLTEAVVFDGEVMGASFQDLMKQARRISNVQADDSVLNLFDIIPLSEFRAGKGTVKQKDRTKLLLNLWHTSEALMPNITCIGTEEVDLDTDAGKSRLLEINTAALNGKYEGIMLKDVDAVYECKRSNNWLKMKPFIEETLKITGVEEGKPDSKFAGTMGALVMSGIVNGKIVNVNVGGGYSNKLRAQIWADFTNKPVTWQKREKTGLVTYIEQPTGTPIIGQLAEVRADALTIADGSSVWSMRFPRFKTFRGFNPGEKI